MKPKFCVEKYATLYPSPDRRHYIIQKAKAAEGQREIGEPLVFTHRPPLFLRPTATTRYCQTPDGRMAVRPGWRRPYMHPQRAARDRGQRERPGWKESQ